MVGKKVPSNNKIVALIVFLVLAILVLLIGIVIVNNLNNKKNREESESQRLEMVNSANDDCNAIIDLYDGGAVDMEWTDKVYEEKMAQQDDNSYKVYLTICYADEVHSRGVSLAKTVEMLKKVEPLLVYDVDYIEYYNRFVVYYVEEEDWDMARYYASLRNEYIPEFKIEDENGEDENEE